MIQPCKWVAQPPATRAIQQRSVSSSRNDVPSYNLYITADDRQWPLAPTVVSNSTSAAVFFGGEEL